MPKSLIQKIIADLISSNSNRYEQGNKIFDDAIIGISSGDDHLYNQMKSDIGDFYWTPEEAFKIAYPDIEFTASDLSVVSWILPFVRETKSSQHNNTEYPSINWVYGRLTGEKFNDEIRETIVNVLKDRGLLAIAPCMMDQWSNQKSDNYGYASSWSERHAAYISGLGTFGLCDGLITEKGKAHRCGSVIVLANLDVTKRSYQVYNEYCLYYKNGSCNKCIKRCVAGAITENGHNKLLCRQYQRDVIREHIKASYNIESSCCGLCQTNVPCESRIP